MMREKEESFWKGDGDNLFTTAVTFLSAITIYIINLCPWKNAAQRSLLHFAQLHFFLCYVSARDSLYTNACWTYFAILPSFPETLLIIANFNLFIISFIWLLIIILILTLSFSLSLHLTTTANYGITPSISFNHSCLHFK